MNTLRTSNKYGQGQLLSQITQDLAENELQPPNT